MSDHHPPPDLRKTGDPNPYQRSATPYATGPGAASASTSARPANTLAVVALVLGIAGFLLGWVPYLGLVLGVAALVISVLALRRAGRLGRKAVSVVALVLSGLSTFSGLTSTVVWTVAGDEIRRDFWAGFHGTGSSGTEVPSLDGTSGDGDPYRTHVLVMGTDLQPGLYTSAVPAGDDALCFWTRISQAPADPAFPDHDHELSSGSAMEGPAAVEMLGTEYGLQVTGCGEWSAVDPATAEPSDAIGSGQHFVGVEMEPGLWQATGPEGDCAWMTSGTTTQEGEYTAIQTGVANAVVEVQPTDEVFSTYGCGTWTEVRRPLTLQPTPAGGVVLTGDDLVGSTIAPGTYVSTASAGDIGCYWEKFADTRMQDQTVNGLHKGQHVVQIEATDVVFSSSADCGGWVPASTTPDIEDTIGDGDWVVGVDIALGTYTSNHDGPADGTCRGEAFSDATHQHDASTGSGYDMDTFTLVPGDHLMTLDGCGTYTRTA